MQTRKEDPVTRKRETPPRTTQQQPAPVAEHLAPADQEPARSIAVRDIVPDPNNPRPFHDDAKYQELKASVQVHGVLQNVLLRPNPQQGAPFMLVAGERRWRAACAAGLLEINAVVRNLDDQQAFELALIENLNREDMTPIEEALAYKKLIEDIHFRLTVADISAKVGKEEHYIRRRLVLANLDPAAMEFVRKEVLTLGGAEELARAPQAVQTKFLATVRQEIDYHEDRKKNVPGASISGPTYRAGEVRRFVRGELRVLPLANAPFDLADETLPPLSCTRCPKNTAQQRDLFTEPDGPGECTEPTCYGIKVDLQWKRVKEKGQQLGVQILEGEEAKKHGGPSGIGWDSELVDLAKDCDEDPEYEEAVRKHEELLDQDQELDTPPERSDPEAPSYQKILGEHLKTHPEHIVLVRLEDRSGRTQIHQCVRRSELPDLMHNAGREDLAKIIKEQTERVARINGRGHQSADHKAELAKRALEQRAEAKALQTCTENIGVFLHQCFGKPATSNDVQKIELKTLLRELVCLFWTKKNSAAAKRRNLGTDPPDSPYSDRVKDEPRLANMDAPALLSFLFELLLEDKCYHFVGKRAHRVLNALSTANYDELRRQFIKDEKDKVKEKKTKAKEKEQKKGKPAPAAPASKKGKKK